MSKMTIKELCEKLEEMENGLDQFDRMSATLENAFLQNRTKTLNLNAPIYTLSISGYPLQENEYIESTLKTYPKLIEKLEQKGFKIKKIPKIIGYKEKITQTKIGTRFFGLLNKYETFLQKEAIIGGETYEISICCEEL